MKIKNLFEYTSPSSQPNQAGGQAPEFGRDPKVLEDDKIDETSAGATGSGSVASVSSPMGSVQRRGKGSMFQGIKTSKKFVNSPVTEDEISEEQLLAKQLRKELFNKAKNKDLGNRPSDREIITKEADKNLPDWMKDTIAMAHRMNPQDKMREKQAERDAQQKAEQHQRLQQDIENLPELIANYKAMEAEYESMGGKNWQYADYEQNLSDEERKARNMEGALSHLANRIHRAKKASEGVAESMDPDQQGRLNELIDDYNLSMKERSYWEADSILDKITREFGKDIADQVDQQGVAEGDMYGDEEVSWEKGGRRAPTGAFRNPAANNIVFSGTGDNGGKYEIIQSGDDFMIHVNGKHIDSYGSLQRAMSVLKNEVPGLKKTVDEESKGLWANIHAKRERIKHGSGEHMRKPGSKGAPTKDAFRKSAK